MPTSNPGFFQHSPHNMTAFRATIKTQLLELYNSQRIRTALKDVGEYYYRFSQLIDNDILADSLLSNPQQLHDHINTDQARMDFVSILSDLAIYKIQDALACAGIEWPAGNVNDAIEEGTHQLAEKRYLQSERAHKAGKRGDHQEREAAEAEHDHYQNQWSRVRNWTVVFEKLQTLSTDITTVMNNILPVNDNYLPMIFPTVPTSPHP